ncbi:MAG: DEAD/DEAH box helicase family protein, partial [Dehalococcoidia bacterium]
PSSVSVTRANLVYIAKEGIPPAMLSRLWRLAAFQNPEFYRAQKLRLSTFGKPRVISCAEDFERHIGLPRGCLDDAKELLSTHGVAVDLVDERRAGTAIDVAFQGRLSPTQQEAADLILAHDTGVLAAPTAFGKTVISAWLIAARKTNTLVLVHRKQLLDQWRDQLCALLSLPPGAIGQVSGGRKQTNGQIDIALVQSLYRRGDVDDLVAQYGQVMVDECHHIPAYTFERVLKATKARFVLGLTATPIRKDGHHPIVFMQCGPLRFQVSPKDEVATRAFEQIVVPRRTNFHLADDTDEPSVQRIYTALAESEERNDLICADFLDLIQRGRTPLLLTERKEHLAFLARRLEGQVPHLVVLHGGMGIKKRKAMAARLQAVPGEESCAILATGRYVGEGFDLPRLDTLLLAMPISWRGTLRQYAGRIQRAHSEKRQVCIYDYVDATVPVLARMYEKRRKGYQAMGYREESNPILI